MHIILPSFLYPSISQGRRTAMSTGSEVTVGAALSSPPHSPAAPSVCSSARLSARQQASRSPCVLAPAHLALPRSCSLALSPPHSLRSRQQRPGAYSRRFSLALRVSGTTVRGQRRSSRTSAAVGAVLAEESAQVRTPCVQSGRGQLS